MVLKKDVLILFSYRSHKNGYIEMLFDRLNTMATSRNSMRLFRGSIMDLQISINNNKLSIIESMTNRDLSSFDLVYFELWYKAQQQALAAARYLDRKKIQYFSHELHQIMPITKVGELAVLADNDVTLPNTFISNRRQIKKAFKNNPPIKYPLIVKAADGYGGKNNHLVSNYDELTGILDANKGVQFVIQEFIDNDCDYRCIVFGGEIKLVLKRTRNKDNQSHLNNTSAGAVGEVVLIVSLPASARKMVLLAAKALNRVEFAGVDLMLEKGSNKPYILEVNQTPQIEIGAEVDKKMNALLDYMELRLGDSNE